MIAILLPRCRAAAALSLHCRTAAALSPWYHLRYRRVAAALSFALSGYRRSIIYTIAAASFAPRAVRYLLFSSFSMSPISVSRLKMMTLSFHSITVFPLGMMTCCPLWIAAISTPSGRFSWASGTPIMVMWE